ncbi:MULTISPECIES: 7-cyano-7-deazaguanine synthase QueC [unclassified Adlercreutzia]|uniref:7-cyano-7-deazaguanine synthase QueC n=1 Tax=unclassified Adlercreutzia TaxID=2636013 RepID=UPI0013EA3CFF|nr:MULTISPECIES: 7-cyano-7-deazaguanine synthase QueC [unclassified Adlercreutzia]
MEEERGGVTASSGAQAGGDVREGAEAQAGGAREGAAAPAEARPRRALVLCSGGVDSTTLLARAVRDFGVGNVVALSITYGQRHVREMDSARAVARHYGVDARTLDLGAIFADSNCSLLAHSTEGVPQASYAEQLACANGPLVSTYVPFRNGLFLSSAASIALSLGCAVLLYGAHHDDWAGDAYPDCSPAFVDAMRRAVEEGTGGELTLEAPYVAWSKADIVREGLALGVPYELTWSCYEGGVTPCGTCGTCIDRARAFAANNVPDPLIGR